MMNPDPTNLGLQMALMQMSQTSKTTPPELEKCPHCGGVIPEKEFSVRESLEMGAIVFVLIFLTLQICTLGVGVMDGMHSYDYDCKWPTSRISYAFPSYALGCWLGGK